MTHPLHWLYQQTGALVIPGPEQCYLCGYACTSKHSVAKAIADTFNSHWLAQCRSSQFLCDACAWYLDSKAGHADYRKMSVVVTRAAWRNWQRADMKADIARWLVDGLEDDAYLVVSLTKKKHILLQAPLNARGSKRLAIQLEEQVAHVDLAVWQAIEQPFMALLALGHGKGEILSGNLYANTLRKHGRLMEAMQHSKYLDPWRKSPPIELYSYTTILEEKEEAIDDGPGRGDATSKRAATGDATDRCGGAAAHDRVEIDRSQLQEPVPSGNMAAVRGADHRRRPHDRDPASIPQPSLWHASDCERGDR